MPEPVDTKLYEKAKKEVYAKYKVHSAFRSAALVKRYKELGGTYTGKRQPKKGLTRWFDEEWKDIGGKKYPVYRPTKRITAETPLTPAEIDKRDLKQKINMKQQYKHKTLPAFQSKK